jgi:hypothetical protein
MIKQEEKFKKKIELLEGKITKLRNCISDLECLNEMTIKRNNQFTTTISLKLFQERCIQLGVIARLQDKIELYERRLDYFTAEINYWSYLNLDKSSNIP